MPKIAGTWFNQGSSQELLYEKVLVLQFAADCSCREIELFNSLGVDFNFAHFSIWLIHVLQCIWRKVYICCTLGIRCWHGAIRQQAIISCDVDPDLLYGAIGEQWVNRLRPHTMWPNQHELRFLFVKCPWGRNQGSKYVYKAVWSAAIFLAYTPKNKHD